MTKKNAMGKRGHTDQGWWSNLSPVRKNVLSVLLLFVIVVVLFHDVVFKDMVFSAEGDTAAALSWKQAGTALAEVEKQEPLWIPYVFSGMPGFASMAYSTTTVSYIQEALHGVGRLLFLNASLSWFVLHYLFGGICMFLLARNLKFQHLPALFAAVTFMLSPYAIGLAQSGHGSKLMTLSYVPLLFLFTYTLFERPNVLTFGLLAATVGTIMLAGHVQIMYYGFLVAGCYLIYNIVLHVRQQPAAVAKSTGLFVLALGLGFAISAFFYMSVQEYAQYSIRGGGTTGAPGGLTYTYATGWSLHPFETLTLLIPSFFGFADPYYWGWKPSSDSTVYIGLLPLFLGVLALLYKRNRETVFFGIVSLLILLASFGSHFPVLFDLMFNYLPYFNKFRAPEMIMQLMPFVVAILGAYGFSLLLNYRESLSEDRVRTLRRVLLYGAGGLGAMLLLCVLFKSGVHDMLSGSMFMKEGEIERYRQQYGQQVNQIMLQIKEERFALMWKDFVKFMVIAIAVLGVTAAYLSNKVRAGAFGIAIISLLVIDLCIVDFKFINPQPQSAQSRKFQPDATVAFLKQQPGQFRIFPLGQLFGDNSYMYHGLESIGGYYPAKLKIYQTMIDSCLYAGPDPAFPLNMNIVNMLNTKYLLAGGQLPAGPFELVNVDQSKRLLTYRNTGAFPRAFFVGQTVVAHNEREVFRILNSAEFNAGRSAVLEKPLPQEILPPDSSYADILEYKSGAIVIGAYSSSPALLVLSEVYYPAGWNAYIDGKETEIFKTNYVLRSIVVPPGEHQIVFKFEPVMYGRGRDISNAAWGVTAILILIGCWRTPSIRSRMFRKQNNAASGEKADS